MTRETFHEALERVELDLLTLGELAGSVGAAGRRRGRRSRRRARRAVIDGDDEIDEMYLQIDSDLLSMLALQSPVAGDLRLVSAILH